MQPIFKMNGSLSDWTKFFQDEIIYLIGAIYCFSLCTINCKIMKKFKNKYYIPSARLSYWDYRWNAAYFVTICAKNREYFFGEFINGEIELSKIGKISEKYWLKIPQHFPFVDLDSFIVMPNHVHGIIIIDKLDGDYKAET